MSRAKQIAYGATALLGLGATTHFNLQFIASEELEGVQGFLEGAFANPASGSLSVDLFVATLAFLLWSFFEARLLRMRGWWVYVLMTFFVAFAVSFPVFLLMRERKLAAA